MSVMRYLTHLGGTAATLGTIGLLMALGGDQRTLGLAVLAANAISTLAVQVLKRLVARPRPCDASGQPLALVALPDPFSFPSGHAAASTAVAATISLAHPWLAPILVPLALVIAASRVTLLVHHLGDVVAGMALGLTGAIVATTLLP